MPLFLWDLPFGLVSDDRGRVIDMSLLSVTSRRALPSCCSSAILVIASMIGLGLFRNLTMRARSWSIFWTFSANATYLMPCGSVSATGGTIYLDCLGWRSRSNSSSLVIEFSRSKALVMIPSENS